MDATSSNSVKVFCNSQVVQNLYFLLTFAIKEEVFKRRRDDPGAIVRKIMESKAKKVLIVDDDNIVAKLEAAKLRKDLEIASEIEFVEKT